jgi:hypothetical protein
MVDLELPTGPVAEHLFDPSDHTDPDEWRVDLALGVLADLVRLSRREAAAPLRRYAEEGAQWFDAVAELIDLEDPSLTAGLDELVAARCDDADLALLIPARFNPVIEAWAARCAGRCGSTGRRRCRERGRGRRSGAAAPTWGCGSSPGTAPGRTSRC